MALNMEMPSPTSSQEAKVETDAERAARLISAAINDQEAAPEPFDVTQLNARVLWGAERGDRWAGQLGPDDATKVIDLLGEIAAEHRRRAEQAEELVQSIRSAARRVVSHGLEPITHTGAYFPAQREGGAAV